MLLVKYIDLMPNRNTHLIIGAGVSALAYAVYKAIKNEESNLEGVLGSLAIGGCFSLLPDLLEPATHPNHRDILHSIVVLAVLGYANFKGLQSDKLDDRQKTLLAVTSAGYGSHLIADSLTPSGIPLM